MEQFKEDLAFARSFLSDVESRLIGRMASPCPEEDIAVLHHFISESMPPYFEVGVLWGGSMVVAGLAMPTGHLYGIDPFFGYYAPGKTDPYVRHGEGKGLVPSREIVNRNLKEYGLAERTTLYTGMHPPLPDDLEETYFGVVFLDGDHQTKSVLADWNAVKHNAGVVIFHDLHLDTVKPAWQKIKQDPMIEEVLYEGGHGRFSRMGVVKVRVE